jgi:hypothetical protein
MTVRIYRSTDASAPVLNGTAGAMVTLLDALLVNGYGSALPLGWTKAFSGANKASYRQPAGTTNGFYIDIDDSTTGNCTMRGYESMTAVNTGTNAFPTAAQSATSLWTKSLEGSTSTAVNWVAVGTDKMFYLWVKLLAAHTTSPGGDYGTMFAFGDILSYKSGDVYNTMITTQPNSGNYYNFMYCSTAINGASNGHFMARTYQQTGTSITINKLIDGAKAGNTSFMGGGNQTSALQYPNPVDANLYMSPIWVGESATSTLRGIVPGAYAPCHYRPLTTGTQFAGTGAFSGKTFETFTLGNSGLGDIGQVFIEVSNTW